MVPQQPTRTAFPRGQRATFDARRSQCLDSDKVGQRRRRWPAPGDRSLSEEKDPIARFIDLLEQAHATGIKNPDAMVLSTADAAGRPSSRQVLLKHVDAHGLVFYTNLGSRKASEIADNPHVSLNFYWRELDRQVIVLGTAEPVGDEEADRYFATRDRGSQLGAWASWQGKPLASKAQLVAEVAKVEARYLGRKIPRPPHWSGFRVVPSYFDFWAEGRFRLHERIVYELRSGDWHHQQVYP